MKTLKTGQRVIINTGQLFKGTEATIKMTINIDGRKRYGVETKGGLTGVYANKDLLTVKPQ
jgi:hypothetical protein